MAWLVCCEPRLPSKVPLGGEEATADTDRARDRTAGAGASRESKAQAADGAESEELDEDRGAEASDQEMPAIVAEKPAAEGECETSDAPSPDCDAIETGPCANIFGKLCAVLTQSVEAAVATSFVNCLAEKNRHSECAAVAACVDTAFTRACVGDEDRDWCKQYLGRCPKTKGFEVYSNQGNCERARASLVDATRDELDACLGEGCDLEGCLEKLAPELGD